MARNRRYRATSVKQVKLARIRELGEEVIIGIDVAKRVQYACIAAAAGDEEVLFRWSHPEETREFFGLCRGMRKQGQKLTMVLEPSGTYGDPFLHWFWQEGIETRRILGQQTRDGSAAIDGVSSGHDAKAAGMLVALHKLGGSREWLERTEGVRNLRALVSKYTLHDRRMQELHGAVEGILARHWPELRDILKPAAKIFWRILAEYGGPRGIAAEPEEVAAYMRRRAGSFLKSEKIEAVIQSAQTTLGVPMLDEEEEWMRTVALEFLRSTELKESTLGQMKAMVSGHADERLVRLLGAGTVATLIAYNLDPLRFDSVGAYRKALGLSLKERSSGQNKGRLRLTKRGAPHARWLLVLAAGRLIGKDPIVNAWHRKKRARDGRAGGLISLVAIARKLVGAAWHVARGADFDAKRLYDVSRLSVIDGDLEELVFEECNSTTSDAGPDEGADSDAPDTVTDNEPEQVEFNDPPQMQEKPKGASTEVAAARGKMAAHGRTPAWRIAGRPASKIFKGIISLLHG